MRAFGESGQWAELNALAKAKKSPIGFAPFLDVCLKQVKYNIESHPAKQCQFLGRKSSGCKIPLSFGARGQAKVCSVIVKTPINGICGTGILSSWVLLGRLQRQLLC